MVASGVVVVALPSAAVPDESARRGVVARARAWFSLNALKIMVGVVVLAVLVGLIVVTVGV